MAKLGFLGLGRMGYPMARNLLRAGHRVALWSNTASKAKQLAEEEKGLACDSPKQVAEQAEYIFVCVGDTKMAEDVLLGSDGVIYGAKPGTVVADASTISPSASRAIGVQLGTKGIQYLDTPCTGSTPGAIAGTLTFMIGGAREIFDKTNPFLENMGKQFY
jgi:3-hydroxyisobutyrate dehydrogenase-like beta-hydroxyacid dehydrogenase